MKLPLHPPRVEVSPELLFVLTRAFSPLSRWGEETVNSRRVWKLAEALDLSCRIGWRVPWVQLVQELGEETATRFVSSYHDAAAAATVINAVTSEVIWQIHQWGVPVVLLKSNALVMSGLTSVGARRFVDIDILVPAAGARAVRSLLVAQGYRGGQHPGGAHQLSSLHHPTGVMVEIHTHVKHMRFVYGEGWVRFEDLEGKGLLRPLPGMIGGWIPSLEFLAGHAVIHGVVQHWRQVGDYPLMRLVKDLADIKAHWGGCVPLEEAIVPWLAAEQVEVEGQAAVDLVRQLETEAPSVGEEHAKRLGENLVLRHVVATRFDRAYQDAVRAAAALWLDTNRSAAVALVRKLRNRLFLSVSSMDQRYRSGNRQIPRAFLYLWRPFDLLGKFAWFVARYVVYRWRSLEGRILRVYPS